MKQNECAGCEWAKDQLQLHRKFMDDMATRYDSKVGDAQTTARLARDQGVKLREEVQKLIPMIHDTINVGHDARKCVQEAKMENAEFKKIMQEYNANFRNDMNRDLRKNMLGSAMGSAIMFAVLAAFAKLVLGL